MYVRMCVDGWMNILPVSIYFSLYLSTFLHRRGRARDTGAEWAPSSHDSFLVDILRILSLSFLR